MFVIGLHNEEVTNGERDLLPIYPKLANSVEEVEYFGLLLVVMVRCNLPWRNF